MSILLKLRKMLEDWMSAAAFAEANEHAAAREVLGVSVEASGPGAHAGLQGIPGIRVWFGTVAAEAQADPLLGVKVWCGTVSA